MKGYITILFIVIIQLNMNAQSWKTPTIEGYGRIVEYDNVAIKPDSTAHYKLFFNITTDKEREGVNVSLWKMARIINLLENGGVPKNNIHIGGVVSGPAALIVLSKDAYFKKTGEANPNLDLIEKLATYGTTLHFCGQAAAEKNIDPEKDLNSHFTLTLSALVDIPTYEMQGYSIIY
ncbi:DsrE family protein [Bizionia myxarmorum]|uniref:DsrE family protein n=1 Tax=Bizionia myxarmorum TaxID=291186 RepID=A0A5D0RAI7_9FLAO|nr:DsrE family protein [Bizionia myxarmorum]TYB78507.1 DsrE family protein [Bizionia myxarmorum]